MSREASYGKTKLNNVKEDAALKVILESSACFQRPDAKTRKKILELLGLGAFSSRAFDLVRTTTPVPPLTPSNVQDCLDAISLVEVKATKAAIEDDNLHGFFFGATDNEYRLAAKLGNRYQFGFVVLSPKGDRAPFFVLLTLDEVEKRTRTKRIQYQVNLKGRNAP